MPRRNSNIKKREINHDTVYNSRLVTMTINRIMLDGKKSLARNIFYKSMEIIKAKTNEEGIIVFEKALANIIPQLELKTKRIGGANYQIPIEVSASRKTTLALRWLINYARLRNEKTMEAKLAGEIIDASKNMGASVKKKEDIHRMAESNRTFSHFK